jgi:hypothetical protein
MLNSNANFAERAALVEAANYAEKAGNVEQYKSINQQIEGLVQRAQKGY